MSMSENRIFSEWFRAEVALLEHVTAVNNFTLSEFYAILIFFLLLLFLTPVCCVVAIKVDLVPTCVCCRMSQSLH